MQEPENQEGKTDAQKRKSRVVRMKKLLIAFLILGIVIPIFLCILLFVKVSRLQEQVNTLTAQKQQEGMELQSLEQANRLTDYLTGTQPQRTILSANEMPRIREKGKTAAQPGTEAGGQTEAVTRVYLTFDDGPSVNTEKLLDILSQYGVKATFFVIGKTQEAYQPVYQRIVDEGHTLGMHSYSHRYQDIYASKEAFQKDLEQLQEFLYDTTGVWSRFYRFPGGSSNAVSEVDMKELTQYLSGEDIYYLDWNVACGDASGKKLKPQQLADNVVDNVLKYQTAVVLLHDGADKTATVEALPIIIERLQELPQVEILAVTDDMNMVQHLKADAAE